jgi:hypothetical protein
MNSYILQIKKIYKNIINYNSNNINSNLSIPNNSNNTLKLGTGKNIFKKELYNDLFLMNKNLTNEKNKLLINVPKNFNNNNYQDLINKMSNNKYKIITLNKDNNPECLRD